MSAPGRAALVAVLALAILAALPPGAEAAGNTYNWLNCHAYNRIGNEADESVGLGETGNFAARDKCAGGEAAYELKNTGFAGGGTQALLQFNAPAGTAIRYFSINIDARSADGYNADISVVDFNGGGTLIYRAQDAPGGYAAFRRGSLDHRNIIVNLYCARAGGCSPSTAAHSFVRDVEIQLADNSDPSHSLGGDLLAGGWRRGTQSLAASASDVGSGLLVFGAQVNGASIGNAGEPGCPSDLSRPYVRRAVPCFAGTASFSRAVDTGAGPFVNGANTVSFFARDYPGNATTVDRTVMVDNAYPQLWFANAENAEDPELIRAHAADQHSGIAGEPKMYYRAVGSAPWQQLATQRSGSEITARVNSSAVPPGDYEFLLEAADVAGNAAASTKRLNGERMVLRFPLKASTTLQSHLGQGGGQAQTLGYGESARAVGRLLDANGNPLAGKRVVVVEKMHRGSLYPRREGDDITDENGRWSVAIPPGPSGTVSASYAGSAKHLASADRTGRITVKSAARFKPVRKRVPEGRTLRFRGSVRHRDARIPRRGKQVEVQVRLGKGRWDTVKQAFRTEADGSYGFRYRFGRHYVQDTRFKFRLEVHGESDWPYAGIVTRPRAVVVEAN